ncbi:D-glycero-beta-D-manno-heptose-7-phosphate kinase [Arcobacter roscoffensis]|uniref:Bifunctional protein HldE n=1 Tax=Arcobacter roscoffensis TaxID=2961520 RepID=A0ABY5E5A6_9BACT|nr:D-glycero-beta-D-manno-heptose-7-phosphate kinase [Arcobacter roscoffensis]UTJ07349.1 D-glycero-beta-D-manno-heptose-7-phosphate kinase [Arcobacter roscoffensis]
METINLKNKNPNILVIGDLMIDHYLWGSCDRISPEAPVPVLKVTKETNVLGGAGNVVNNLNALGANIGALSVIGDDKIANELKSMLESIETKNFLVVQKNRETSKKSRLIASNQQIIRYDKETTFDIDKKSEAKLLEILEKQIKNYDLVLLSDYGKGVLTNSLTKNIISLVNSQNKKVLVDPKGSDYSKYKNSYLLTPNKKEASLATNIDITDEKSLYIAISKLKNDYKLDISLITLSEEGIAIFDEELRVKPTVAREVYDVTGAGDTVLASIAFAISCGLDINTAVSFANLASGVVVGKLGSATATLDEIIEYEASLNQNSSSSQIKTKDEMINLSKKLKQKNKKIVFTNGCFDILHVGHIKYLEVAKSFGDVLILGLNTDSSVKRLKGESRPINPQEDRAYTLAALKSVDYVVQFDEDTPYELIKALNPDVLVKGGDYKGKEVVGQDLVKELRLVDFVEGKSTTSTIQRIKSND